MRILLALLIASFAAACATGPYGYAPPPVDPAHDGNHCIHRQFPACPNGVE